MAEETIKIYVWPDGSWVSDEDIDDLDWYLESNGKSDDYATYDIPLELEAEDIDELIELNALPGMLTNVPRLEDMGKISVPDEAIVVVHHSEDIDYNAVTMLSNKLIVNAPNVMIEVIKSRIEKNNG